MATLTELRTELGVSLGMMREGVTTSSGSTTSLIDTTGLQNFATSGMLVGATLYIPSLSEWTTINEYDGPNHTLKWHTPPLPGLSALMSHTNYTCPTYHSRPGSRPSTRR